MLPKDSPMRRLLDDAGLWWFSRIRGIEEIPGYRSFRRNLEARAVGREEALARNCPELTSALTVDFAKLFIMGRAEQARTDLIRLGTKKFGTPAEEVAARIAAMIDIDVLEDLIDRVLDVASWDELLQLLASRSEFVCD